MSIVAKMSKAMEAKHMGSEPKSGEVITDIIRTYNMYNYFYSRKESLEFFEKYLIEKKHPFVKKFQYMNTNTYSTTVGWCADIILRGAILPQESLDWFENKISEYDAATVIQTKTETNRPKTFKDKPHIEKVEEIIDNYFVDWNSDVNLSAIIQENGWSTSQVREIGSLISKLYEEIKEYETDPQVKEAYRFMSTLKRRQYIKFLESLLSPTDNHIKNANRLRKPRKKAKISEEKKVSKMKYLSHCQELNISSLSPSTVVQSSKVVLYDTKLRVVSVYIGKEDSLIEVRGTTIQNYDEEKSYTKKLRKPKESLELIINSTKRTIDKVVEGISGRNLPAKSGRLNENQLIIKGWK